MPVIGARCHELRIRDAEAGKTWRVVCRTDPDAIVIVDVFAKKTQKTPSDVIANAKRRLRNYDEAVEE